MPSSLHRNKNCLIESPKMGLMLFSPRHVVQEEFDRVSAVICPRKIRESNEFVALSEWAALTQTPLYCLPADRQTLKSEGFGDYRFQSVLPYRRVHMYGGTLEFIPIPKTEKFLFFKRRVQPDSFHVLLRAFGEQPILYLSEPKISFEDAVICKNLQPRCYAVKQDGTEAAWEEIEKVLGSSIDLPTFVLEKKTKKKIWKAATVTQHISELESPETPPAVVVEGTADPVSE
jgi:hypothetical protein